MTHPEELLADYADGTLDERQRAVVDAHLRGCDRCRGELSLAVRARASLQALRDEPVPFGVTGPVVSEAGRRFERRQGVVWRRLQWAAGLAAAAALVAVFTVNIGDRDGPQEAAQPAAGDAATPAAPEGSGAAAEALQGFAGLERQQGVTYDSVGIEAVARDASEAIAAGQAAEDAEAPESRTVGLKLAAPDAALRCVARSGGPTPGPTETLVRLIEAEYEDARAYIAVFAEGPGAGQAPDHVVVWVVAAEDCRILTTASQRVPLR